MGEKNKERENNEGRVVGEIDEVERLRASIELTRGQISAALDEVQDGVQETLDWKLWVKRHPKETIGIAFAIGFLLGKGR